MSSQLASTGAQGHLVRPLVEAIECEDDPLGNGSLSEHMDRLRQYNHQNYSKILKSYTSGSVMEPFAKHIVEALLKRFAISDVYYSPLDSKN